MPECEYSSSGRHNFVWSKYCGAYVCSECEEHKGLAKCYCGWNLFEGEVLEDDVGDYVFNGEYWEGDY